MGKNGGKNKVPEHHFLKFSHYQTFVQNPYLVPRGSFLSWERYIIDMNEEYNDKVDDIDFYIRWVKMAAKIKYPNITF